MKVNATIALDADDDELEKRILERGKTSGRTDDQDPEKIRNRFANYQKETAPLKAYYEKQGKFHSVNGIGNIDDITGRLSKIIDTL